MIVKKESTKEFFIEENCHITELLNQPDFPQVSVAKARVLAGEWTELHSLKATEIYYILKGKGKVEVDGKEARLVLPGDLVAIKQDVTQRIFNAGNEDLVFLAICTPRFLPEKYKAHE